MRQPFLIRLLEHLTTGPDREHVIGDIAEEHRRIRADSSTGAQWWLMRQTVGALVHRRRATSADRVVRGTVRPRLSRMPRFGVGVFIETWLKDLRFGIRLLLRDRIVTCTIVATLSLGIGATATMYSITRGILRELPFDKPHQIVSISLTDVERSARNQDVPLIDLDEWRRVQTTMVDVAAMRRQPFHITTGDNPPVRVQGAAISPWSFALLCVTPAMGNDFRDGEPATIASNVVIGFEVWRDAFASAEDVVGSTLRVDGRQHTVIGVMPEGFGFPRSEQVWIALPSARVGMNPTMRGPERQERPILRRAAVFGRVASDFSIHDVRSELSVLGRPSQQLGVDVRASEVVEVAPFTHQFVGSDANGLLYTMLAIVSSVLLIACANVTNLLLARAAVRKREMAVRAALGCPPGRLVRQMLTESFIMAVLGSVGGIASAFLAVRWFNGTVGHRIDLFWVSIAVDATVLGFVVLLTVLTALFVGLVPALRASRIDVSHQLKEGIGAASPIRLGRVTRWLVVAEIAVSMVLLVSSGLMVRGVVGLSMRNIEFDTKHVATGRVRLGAFAYPNDSSLVLFYEQLERQWAKRNGGSLVMTSALPGQQTGRWTFAIDGVPYAEHADLPAAPLRFVTDDFFHTFELAPVTGRVLDARDVVGGRAVAVVNKAFAFQFFDGVAIGHRIRLGDLDSEQPWREIVGVADDRGATLEEGRNAPGIFIPLAQSPRRTITVAARHDGLSMEAASTALRDAVWGVDDELPLYDTATLEYALADEISPQRTFAILFGVFGGLALLLAAVGLYGTMAFTVLQRQHEFGVRRALGARSIHLVFSVARGVGGQLMLGIAIGVGLAVMVSPLLKDFTFGADPRDPLVFVIVVVALSLTAGIASIVPTARATRVDPMLVLRDE